MQNKVINHILHNKIAYAILGIVVAVIGFTLFQTPNFSDTALTGNVGNVTGGTTGPKVTFADAQDFTVTQGGDASFTVVSEPGAKISFWLVNLTKTGLRPVKLGIQTADASGMATYHGALPSKLKSNLAYQLGLQVTLGDKRTIAISNFNVTVADAVSSQMATGVDDAVNSGGLVTLVTADGQALTVVQGDEVTLALPATKTAGFTVALQSNTTGVAPVVLAKQVKGVFTFKVSNDVSGAYNLKVTDTAGVAVNGLTLTVTNVNTGVSTTVNQTSGTTATSAVDSTATATSSLESSVADSNQVTFTSPTSSVKVVAGKDPVVVSFKATSATELFTLYAVNVATSKEVRFAKGVTSGEVVTWLPTEEGNYQLVAAGSTSQVTSEFRVSVVSASGTAATESSTAAGTAADPTTVPATSTAPAKPLPTGTAAPKTETSSTGTTAGMTETSTSTANFNSTAASTSATNTAADGGDIKLCPPGSDPICGIDSLQ